MRAFTKNAHKHDCQRGRQDILLPDQQLCGHSFNRNVRSTSQQSSAVAVGTGGLFVLVFAAVAAAVFIWFQEQNTVSKSLSLCDPDSLVIIR